MDTIWNVFGSKATVLQSFKEKVLVSTELPSYPPQFFRQDCIFHSILQEDLNTTKILPPPKETYFLLK